MAVDVNPEARLIFFEVLDQQWPSVLNSLLTDVWRPLYLLLFEEVPKLDRESFHLPIAQTETLLKGGYMLFYAPYIPERASAPSEFITYSVPADVISWARLSRSSIAGLENLRVGLESWARQFKFRNPWILSAALFTMSKCPPGTSLDHTQWCYDGGAEMSRGWPSFNPTFESAIWCGEADPRMSWHAFERAFKMQLQRQLKNYRKEVESLFPPIGRKAHLRRAASWTVSILRTAGPTYDKKAITQSIGQLSQTLSTSYRDPDQTISRAVLRFATTMDLYLPWSRT
jgi:hypothetical protein